MGALVFVQDAKIVFLLSLFSLSALCTTHLGPYCCALSYICISHLHSKGKKTGASKLQFICDLAALVGRVPPLQHLLHRVIRCACPSLERGTLK